MKFNFIEQTNLLFLLAVTQNRTLCKAEEMLVKYSHKFMGSC